MIHLDVWLYGELAACGGAAPAACFAHREITLPAGSSMAALLAHLGIPTEARGITFINGHLSALPGRQPDLGRILRDGDRIGLFDLRSMWPFQYRHGVAMIEELSDALSSDQGIHHMPDPPSSG